MLPVVRPSFRHGDDRATGSGRTAAILGPRTVVRMATYTEHLRDRGPDGLAAVLALRPDLAAPPPATVRALAARAANRASLERVLATFDTRTLTVLEAVVALEGTVRDAPSADDVARAVGDDVGTELQRALDTAVLWSDGGLRPSPGLVEVLGPYPAGLGPSLAATLARRSTTSLATLAEQTGATGSAPEALARYLAAPTVVDRLLAAAPRGARQVLQALAAGPPVGRMPDVPGPAQAAVGWLLAHGLLSGGDPQHVVLPREVALVLRQDRTHLDLPDAPRPLGRAVAPATVDAEATRAAEGLVRLAGGVLTAWGREQPSVLRSGGLGARELRRLVTRLEVDETTTALVVEVVAAAGLVVDDGDDPPTFCPTTAADDWLALPPAERWAHLAQAWLSAERAPWLVGTRDERGALRTALDPESRRPWAPRLRRAVLGVLAQDGALSAEQVHEVLVWRTPRAAPALHAVSAVMAEAEVLGVTGAGAVGATGAALLAQRGAAAIGAELAALLPPSIDHVLLQGDLTGVVPGRPSEPLDTLLTLCAVVESRGAGVTVRFTEASVRAALDTGLSAEELLAALSRHARSGVPQPLEYLVLDASRRHGQVRVGLASSYLRGDAAALAGLAEDRALSGLGLLRLAPTVLAAQVSPAALVTALRERGLSPVTEDATGVVVLLDVRPRRVRVPRRAARPVDEEPAPSTPDAGAATERRLRRVARDLIAGDRREAAAGPQVQTSGEADPTDPVHALDLLRDAAARGVEVWLDVVGPQGTTRRRVRPVHVDGGRVRAIDAEREAELTVAVHRIAQVTLVQADE